MNPQEGDAMATLRLSVRRYLSERLDATAISTADATRAVRRWAPDCDLTDGELANYVAEDAIAAGFAVSFDGKANVDCAEKGLSVASGSPSTLRSSKRRPS